MNAVAYEENVTNGNEEEKRMLRISECFIVLAGYRVLAESVSSGIRVLTHLSLLLRLPTTHHCLLGVEKVVKDRLCVLYKTRYNRFERKKLFERARIMMSRKNLGSDRP